MTELHCNVCLLREPKPLGRLGPRHRAKVGNSAGAKIRFQRFHARFGHGVDAVAVSVGLAGTAEHGCALQGTVRVPECNPGTLGRDEALQDFRVVLGFIWLGMLQHFGPGLIDTVQPGVSKDLGDGIAGHNVHVAAISGHASLELGIGRGEIRRVFSQRAPAGHNSTNADQNDFRGRPQTHSV